jgi:hypothetical protein
MQIVNPCAMALSSQVNDRVRELWPPAVGWMESPDEPAFRAGFLSLVLL